MLSRYIQPSGQSSMLSEIYPTLRSVLNAVRDISNPQVSPQCCQRYIQPSGQSSMLSEIYPTLRSVLNAVRDISNPQVSPQCCQRYIQSSGQSMLSEIYPTLRSALNIVRHFSKPQVSPQCCQDISNPQVSPQCCQRYIQSSGQSMLSEIYPTLRSALNIVRHFSKPQVSPQCCQDISNPQDGMKMCTFMQNALTRLLRLPLLSVALVEGNALGGGAELTTASDFRLISPGSVIQFVHKHMGLVPGWGGAARLVRIVGGQNALKMLGGALKIDPEMGLQIGLADGVLEGSLAGSGTNALLEAEQ
ncbi:uncharacterized protein LOC109885705 isoform X1 [Oncorhynchus kisutch]|uniref:uncharacterized protein LOC109885705 isoform X1 n=1 Tax=Oncorhynchus kisutch TaxID=8019 RepID=UPI0012DC2CB6|nr:uncharacterized protein LOC109885705 isoform X1 [Oncorhynchus kisutch]